MLYSLQSSSSWSQTDNEPVVDPGGSELIRTNQWRILYHGSMWIQYAEENIYVIVFKEISAYTYPHYTRNR